MNSKHPKYAGFKWVGTNSKCPCRKHPISGLLSPLSTIRLVGNLSPLKLLEGFKKKLSFKVFSPPSEII